MHRSQASLFLGGIALIHAPTASAYVGPTLGLGVIATVLAIIAVTLLSLAAFVVLPIRRLLKKSKRKSAPDPDPPKAPEP